MLPQDNIRAREHAPLKARLSDITFCLSQQVLGVATFVCPFVRVLARHMVASKG